MAWDIDLTLVEAWLSTLDRKTFALVAAALEILEEDGPTVGRPLVDTVRASRHRNMKELRPGSIG